MTSFVIHVFKIIVCKKSQFRIFLQFKPYLFYMLVFFRWPGNYLFWNPIFSELRLSPTTEYVFPPNLIKLENDSSDFISCFYPLLTLEKTIYNRVEMRPQRLQNTNQIEKIYTHYKYHWWYNVITKVVIRVGQSKEQV